MGYLSGLSREFEFPEDLKKKINIGILGSFRRPHLEMLKRHLCDDEGLGARLSYDLQEQNPQRPDEGHPEYNVRMSEHLIDKSHIHIVYYFKEGENEHGINDSATYELGYLRAARKHTPSIGRYVVVLCEDGYDARNIGAMRKGIATFVTVLKHALDPRAWPPTRLRRMGCVIPCDCVLPGQPPAWAGQGSKRFCHILYPP